MVTVYLWFNSALYFLFGVWCSLDHGKTAKAQGFLSFDDNGHCEYLAVYGGMEIGFAVFYALCALRPELRSTGILFSVCIYSGIVAWRMTSLFYYSNISATTKGIAGLEIVLLASATLLYFKFRDA